MSVSTDTDASGRGLTSAIPGGSASLPHFASIRANYRRGANQWNEPMIPPNEPSADSAPHEFIDAEISVDGIENPTDEKTLSTALHGLAGIRNFTIAGGKT